MAFIIKGLTSDGKLPSSAKADLSTDIGTPASTVRAALDAAGLGAGASDADIAAFVADTGSATGSALSTRFALKGEAGGGADVSALADQAGRKLAATTAGRLAEPAPGVSVGPMSAFATATTTSLGSVTFTPDPQAITVSKDHGLKVGDPVAFIALSGVTGIDGSNVYFVQSVPTPATLRIASSVGGNALTVNGTGTATGIVRRSYAYHRGSGTVFAGMRVTEGRAVQAAATFPRYDRIAPDKTVVTYAPGNIAGTALRLSTEYTGQSIDLLVSNTGPATGRIIVDGLEAGGWTAANFSAVGVGVGSLARLPLSFSDARRRTIDIVFTSPSDEFGGFDYGTQGAPSYPLSAGPKGARWMFSGDSFTEGTGAAAGWGYVRWVAEHLGWKDAWKAGSGSTGYVQNGARANLLGRYQNDILDQNPDGVVLAYGINDGDAWDANSQTVRDAVATVWDAILADTTIKDLVVVGPWPNSGGTGVQQRYIDMDAAFADMAKTRGLKYISPISEGWTFTLSDPTHPDAAGHELIGRKVAGHLSI